MPIKPARAESIAKQIGVINSLLEKKRPATPACRELARLMSHLLADVQKIIAAEKTGKPGGK